MTTFIGDYQCKIDAKGRLLLPAAFKKQLNTTAPDRFVVKKDIYEPCLVLYPYEEWERQVALIRKHTNPYNKQHSNFLRGFFNGTAEIQLDASNRLLIPKRLLEQAEIESDICMIGIDGKIEIWAEHLYTKLNEKLENFADLAEQILGNSQNFENT